MSSSVQHFQQESAIDTSEAGGDKAHSFNSKLLQRLNKVVLKADSKRLKLSTKAEKMWREFHVLRGTELCEMWKEFLHQVKIAANEPLLFQYVVENVFSEVVKSHFSTLPESSVLLQSMNRMPLVMLLGTYRMP